MQGLTLNRKRSAVVEVLCIGAHCDDIEIGCGGTLLMLQRHYPRVRIHWAVLSSTAARRREALRAMKAFVAPRARGHCQIGALPDGHLPADLGAAKAFLSGIRERIGADLIIGPQRDDRHQDHRFVSDVIWQTFRDHLVLEYEIPKYDGGLTTPTCYVPVSQAAATRKARLLMRLYATQRDKHWFSEQTFLSLMRVRGVECRSPSGLAEGFHGHKLLLALGSSDG
jgi:LmbE family N-acetylglucosaminyl deacetylase